MVTGRWTNPYHHGYTTYSLCTFARHGRKELFQAWICHGYRDTVAIRLWRNSMGRDWEQWSPLLVADANAFVPHVIAFYSITFKALWVNQTRKIWANIPQQCSSMICVCSEACPETKLNQDRPLGQHDNRLLCNYGNELQLVLGFIAARADLLVSLSIANTGNMRPCNLL